MQDLLQAFGIDWRLLIIQIINFAILVGALWYLLYKPVLKMLKEREDMVAKGVKDAEDAQKAKEEIENTKGSMLKQAEHTAQEVVAHAKEQGVAERTKIVSDAEAHADKVKKDAELRAQESKARAQKEAEKDIARLSVLAAEKVLQKK